MHKMIHNADPCKQRYFKASIT